MSIRSFKKRRESFFLTFHNRLNVADLFGYLRRKKLVAGFRNQNVVLDSYPEPAIFRLHRLGIGWDIDPRFNGNDHTGLELGSRADIVHIEAERMSNAVTDKLSVAGFYNNRPGARVKFPDGKSGLYHLNDFLLSLENNLIDLFLRFGEFPRHGNGSCDIRGIALVFCPYIHHHEVSALRLSLVQIVVENQRILAGSDNRREALIIGSVASHLILNLSLKLVFPRARPAHLPCPLQSGAGHIDRRLNECNFRSGFDGPYGIDEAAHMFHLDHRMHLFDLLSFISFDE